METQGIHRPNPGNIFAPYFPAETIRRCKRDVRRVFGYIPTRAIKKLRTALRKREVSGSSSVTDLLGTLARIYIGSRSRERILKRRATLYKLIKRRPHLDNNFEYWSFQIAGRPTLGIHVSKHRCMFTEMTIKWCSEVIAERQKLRT